MAHISNNAKHIDKQTAECLVALRSRIMEPVASATQLQVPSFVEPTKIGPLCFKYPSQVSNTKRSSLLRLRTLLLINQQSRVSLVYST